MGEEAVALARATSDDFVLAIALNNLGGVMALLGDNERAAAYFDESLEVRRRLGDLSRIALSLANVAAMALQEGKTTKAAAMFAEAAEIATAIGDKRHILLRARRARPGRLSRRAMGGGKHAHTGKPAPRTRTRHEATRGGTDPRPRRDRHGHGRHGTGFAACRRRCDPPPLLAPDGAEYVEYQDVIEPVKARCDPETWEQASVEGAAMTLDEVADYALSSA